MTDGKNLFDQPIKKHLIAYENIQKTETSQGDDYKTGFLLYYKYFNNHYKTIARNLGKQQRFYADQKAI